ncbi:hypothetical protein Tco_1081221 [Tanacetum coccineum]|uniref:Uncharacterized protein n=1 Tax=Tanacetum coccineum TaxID=301880 RepID=A0ABQ5HX29_9ASTR
MKKESLRRYLLKAVFEYVQPRMESTVRDVLKKNPINFFSSSSTSADSLTKYELKHKLYDMMQKSRSFLAHEKHLELNKSDWFKEPNANDAPEQNWFNELVNDEKEPKEFDDMMGSTNDFTKFAKNYLKKDKIMKADLEGPAFTLLKGNYKNSIELEYNMENAIFSDGPDSNG